MGISLSFSMSLFFSISPSFRRVARKLGCRIDFPHLKASEEGVATFSTGDSHVEMSLNTQPRTAPTAARCSHSVWRANNGINKGHLRTYLPALLNPCAGEPQLTEQQQRKWLIEFYCRVPSVSPACSEQFRCCIRVKVQRGRTVCVGSKSWMFQPFKVCPSQFTLIIKSTPYAYCVKILCINSSIFLLKYTCWCTSG